MTVTNSQIRVSYLGDGTTKSFPIPFPFFLTTDLKVYLATQQIFSGYSTTGGGGTLGTLNMASAPTSGVTLQILLDDPLTQTKDFVDGTAFPSATINEVNDRAVQIDLRSRDLIARCIRAPDGDVSPGMSLPAAAIRANLWLAFDASGNITTAAGLPPNQTLSQATIGLFLYPQTAAEAAAGVTPANYAKAPLDIERYTVNVTPGTTSMASALQSAVNVARLNGGVIRIGTGPFLIDAAINCATPVGGQYCAYAIKGEGRFKAPTNTPNTAATPSIILKHTGIAFDTTGSLGVHFENLSIATDETTYPQICFLLARNSDGGSRSDRITNCYVLGRFSKTILYNYACEDGTYAGNQFYNIAAESDTSVFDITGFNRRAVTSAFTTIASGSQSCLDHKIFSGEYANLFQGSGVSADVFRFDGARSIKIYGIWIDSSAKDGSSAGRSLFYIDGTNAALSGLVLSGIDGEAALHSANYGILVSANAQTHGNILIEGCYFPNSAATIGGGTGATISGLTWINSTNSSQGGNIIFNGALVNCLFDGTSSTVSAGSVDNFTNTFNGAILSQANGEAGINLRDFSQASGSQWIKVRYQGAHVSIARCTDVGAPSSTLLDLTTGGTGFNGSAALAKPTITGSKGANAALTSLLTALASYGLVTDSTT